MFSILMACNSKPSAEEAILKNTCIEMDRAIHKGMNKPFDEAKYAAKCECSAKILAADCGSNCATEDGAGLYVLTITTDLANKVQDECKL